MEGTVINLNEDQKKVLSSIRRADRDLDVMFLKLSSKIEANHQHLWRTIWSIFPELYDYHVSINWKDWKIAVTHKMSEWEKETRSRRCEED
ncbi:hypothetical protein LCGC14_2854970 [marine sediment metagenome]|uniref:Uncharacterized protein n=1 Tax=marine sediment metagenome TaxID=412755 RepID=A0A0F8YU32_9ZZZZ